MTIAAPRAPYGRTLLLPDADILAEALRTTISGEPLPATLRPTVLMPAAPASAEEWIARILAAPGRG